MAKYNVVIKKSAQKEIRDDIEGKANRRRISEWIQSLATRPRPPGSEKLVGFDEHYRNRQGDYRIVYRVDDDSKTVTIVRVAQRGSVYKRR